jgi:hypothetical protein
MLIVYRGGVDWQETTALAITAATVGAFVWARWRRRKFRFQRDTHCGCASANQSTPASGSIVFHARKGERPQIIMKAR